VPPVVRWGNALGIHCHGREQQARLCEGRAGAPIAGVFDPGTVADIGQDLGAQAQAVLGAICHGDLAGVAAHTPRGTQVGGDGLAQLGLAHGVAVAQIRRAQLASRTIAQAQPGLEREGVQRRHTGHERPQLILWAAPPVAGLHAPGQAGCHHGPRTSGFMGIRDGAGLA